MSKFKPRLKIIPIVVSVVISAMAAGCLHDNNKETQTETKDDAYYEKIAKELLSKLSLSEKLDIVSGPGINLATRTPYETINVKGDVLAAVGYVNGVKNDKVDIPAVKLDDGPAGLKIAPTAEGRSGTTYATAWPIGTQLASTWNEDLIKDVGEAFGEEVKEYGVDFILSPGMNIQRNPLTGRNFEYFSEDPLLTGKIGAAIVEGFQSNGIGATVKHFFGNESETNRDYLDVISDPRSLREIYMRGFEIAIDEAQPWAVMSPYNKINGTYVDQRKDVLTNILRDEWGFKGLVMSDWFAGDIFGDSEAAANMMKAGNDLIEPGGVKENLQASIDAGTLTEDDINKNVVKILTQVQKTPSYNQYSFTANPDLVSHANLARQAGDEGMVLLKNEAGLPLSSSSKIASFGVGQLGTYKGGTGSGNVFSEYIINIADGLASKFTLDSDVLEYYNTYFESNRVAHYDSWGPLSHYSYDEPAVTGNNELTTALANSAASDDAAVITISRIAGEGSDRTNSKGDYLLNDNEMDMITSVSDSFHAQGKKVIVVLNVGGIIDTSEWADKVDGILLAYMGGQEIGYEIADIISGDVNPSGKLTQTIPASYSDNPSSSTFPGVDTSGDGVVDEIYYNEGIYVGYRYYDTFNKSVAYPFGFGLSYTTFNIDGSAVTENTLDNGSSGSVTLTAKVTNTGNIAGKEVAQVYINAPEVKLKKPTIELKAFDKTESLVAGASETLTFNIPAKLLASFDSTNNQWIVEPGTYKAYIANSSDVSGVEPVTFTVSKEVVVSNTTPGAIALPSGVTEADFITVSK